MFLEPSAKPTVIYIGSSLEFGIACEKSSWNHCTSKPHLPETNGIVERTVRRIKEGTSAVLLQSGPVASSCVECQCNLRNVQDLLAYGTTPYERRSGELLKGPVSPFGSVVEYHPFSAKVKAPPSRQESFILEYSLDTHCMREELRMLRSWKIWTRRKSPLGDSMQRRSSRRKNGQIFIFSDRKLHVELKWLWVQDVVKEGPVKLKTVKGNENVADHLTKPKSKAEVAQEGGGGVRGVVRREPPLGPRRRGGSHLWRVYALIAHWSVKPGRDPSVSGV